MGPPRLVGGPSSSRGLRQMGGVPDDIKIIAQFLAAQKEPKRRWEEMTREAFSLRRQLKLRGGFRLTRGGAPPVA